MASFPVSRHEKTAVACALACLVFGVFMSVHFEPTWLNRSGSLVIVVSVLLAASRLTEITEAKLQKLIGDNFEKGMDSAIEVIEKTHGHSLDKYQRGALKEGVYTSMTRAFSELFEAWRRRVKIYEVSLVVAGTLVNGFGDWLFCLAVTCTKT